jgi:hypothetical protein
MAQNDSAYAERPKKVYVAIAPRVRSGGKIFKGHVQ